MPIHLVIHAAYVQCVFLNKLYKIWLKYRKKFFDAYIEGNWDGLIYVIGIKGEIQLDVVRFLILILD